MLQNAFEEWLADRNHKVEHMSLKVTEGYNYPDLVNYTTGEIIEVKITSSRNVVRGAVGQVLDYAHKANDQHPWSGGAWNPALLLPQKPLEDLIDYLKNQGISIYIPTDEKSDHFKLVGDTRGRSAAKRIPE